mmetsp:Transcript_67463/g.106784  ORF Transcript_67463/g.106784 Transcript_67463/m.106784 type:complete len:184 (-) Transcript_67463:189-740(-)
MRAITIALACVSYSGYARRVQAKPEMSLVPIQCPEPATRSVASKGNCECPSGTACSEDGKNVGCPVIEHGDMRTEETLFHPTCTWCQCYEMEPEQAHAAEQDGQFQCPDPSTECEQHPGHCQCPRGMACSQDGEMVGCPILLNGREYSDDTLFHSACTWCKCYQIESQAFEWPYGQRSNVRRS